MAPIKMQLGRSGRVHRKVFKLALQLCTHMAIIVTPLKSDAINSKLFSCFRFSLADADVSTELPV